MMQQAAFDFNGPSIATSEQLRDAGIAKGVDHANTVEPGWSDRAYNFLLEFIARTDVDFMAEDVRSFAERRGFSAPMSSRAWGGVMVRAKHAGLIESVGIRQVKNKTAHCANATVWKVKSKLA